MVFELIISSIVTLIKAVLSVLPSVPATPTAVISGGQWAIDQIVSVVSLLTMLFSAPLFVAMVAVGGSIIAFEAVYHVVMWVLKKVPMISIR